MMSLPPIILSPIEEEEEGLEWLDGEEENDLIKPIRHDGHLHISPTSTSESRPPLAPLSHHSILSRSQSYADIQNIKHIDTQHIKSTHDIQHTVKVHIQSHHVEKIQPQHQEKISSQPQHQQKISSQILSEKCNMTKHVKPLQLDIIPIVEVSAYHPRASRPLSASHLYHLRHTEHQYRPTQPLPSHHLQHRPQLIRWLCDVTQRYGINSITLHLSIYYLDRLLMGWDPSPKRLHLLACVCLWIACKCEEREDHIISLHTLAHETRQAYPLEWIREMEKIVLIRLEWSLVMVTPVHFLDLYVMMMEQHYYTCTNNNVDMLSSRSLSSSPTIGMTSPSSFNDMMSPSSTSSVSYMSSPTSSFDLSTSTSPSPRSFSSYITLFTDLSLHDYTYQRYLPSILAASILACARHATGMELWNDEMVELTTCEQEEIMMPFQQLYGSYLRLYPEAAYRSPSPEFQLSSSDMTD